MEENQKLFTDFIKGIFRRRHIKYIKIVTLNSKQQNIAELTVNADMFRGSKQ